MMDERETDKRLSDLFKRNAPYVDELLLRERINDRLPRRRRRSRRTRTARAVAVGFASVVLIGGAAFGAYELVTYLQGQPALVITDLTVQPGDTGPLGTGPAGTSVIAGLVPVVGTAVPGQVKSQGSAVRSGTGTRVTGQVQEFLLDTSQPGISGTLEMTSELFVHADGSADVNATWVLTNNQGTWRCTSWLGYRTADGIEEFGYGSAPGDGGFAGLTLYLQWHSTKAPGASVTGAGATESITITGWIQPAE
jgi:hypothetical protein